MKTMREQYDEIYNSLINGQNKQSIEQMKALGMYEFPGLLDYFSYELNQPEAALKLAKVYFFIMAQD